MLFVNVAENHCTVQSEEENKKKSEKLSFAPFAVHGVPLIVGNI